MKNLLKKSIKKNIGRVCDIALSLSGGTDSLCLLWACLELGIKPHLYTYMLYGNESEDLKRAEMMASKYHLEFDVAVIPHGIEILKKDVKRIISDGVKGKVNIQCLHGHYYLAPMIKESLILNGSGIDGIYGAYKSMAITASKSGLDFQIQRNKYLGNPNADGMVYQRELYKRYNTKVVFPYRDYPIIKYLMSKTWKEMNRPKTKWIIVKEFMDYYNDAKGLFRPRGSQQIVCGTRDYHDLLLTTELNKGHKRVDEIYKDIERSIKCQQ